MEQARRSAVVELARAGKRASEIATLLSYPRSTVYDIYNKWKSSGQWTRKVHGPRRDRKRTPTFLAGLKRSITANPSTPMNTLAKKRSVHRSTISRAIKTNLGYTSYKKTKKHILTAKMRAIRLSRSRKLLNQLKASRRPITFFSDEKKWIVDMAHNNQNDRFLATSKEDVPVVQRTKFPASVMTLGVIGSNGKVMPPVFFRPKETVGADRYCEVLKEQVIPWMKANCNGHGFIFQQDSAPAHKAKKTIELLKKENVDFWCPQTWPSNSPDLNPMDYFF